VRWLHAPTEKRALGDPAKLAVALRGGAIPAALVDGGVADVSLGFVGRVTLLAPADLGLPASARTLALARGSDAWCLAEIVATGDRAAAEALLGAIAALVAGEGARRVVPWLVALHVADDARALVEAAGGAVTSTE
jgi:hypothetical protein